MKEIALLALFFGLLSVALFVIGWNIKIVPVTDKYSNEYSQEQKMRKHLFFGFSAGFALITILSLWIIIK